MHMQEIRCLTQPSLGFVWELTQVVPSPSPRSSVLPNPTFNLFNDRRDKQMAGRWAIDGFLRRLNPSLCSVNRKKTGTSVKGGRKVETGNKRLAVSGIFFDMQKKRRRGEEWPFYPSLVCTPQFQSTCLGGERKEEGDERGGESHFSTGRSSLCLIAFCLPSKNSAVNSCPKATL